VAGTLRSRYAGSTRATPELSEAAARVTAGIDDPVARARALYDHVNQLIPAEGGGGEAAAILLEKTGNRNVLYKALLDLAKVPSRWAFLRPQEAALPRTDWSYPRPDMFPYPYLVLEPEGKSALYISLSQRMTPFGRLPEYLQGGKALIVDARGMTMALLPAPDLEESAASVKGTMTLQGDLEVRVEVELASRSVSVLAQKDRLKTLPAFQRDVALRSLANKMFPGSKVEKAEFQGLEDPEKPFVIAIRLNAPKALRQSGDEHLLKPILQPSQMVAVFCGRSAREHPFFLPSGFQRVVRDSLRIEAGENYHLQRAPPDTLLINPLGTFTLSYQTDGDTAFVKREMNLLPGRLTADDFPAFVDFCEKIDAAEQESIIFRKK
jgi:hypothetical protein